MFAACKRFLRNKKGQSLVETAFVLPIILLLFCGIVDFGWIMGNRVIAENASREGARLGAVVGTKADYDDQIESRVMAVTPSYSHAGIVISTKLTDPSEPTKGDVSVTVSYTFKLLTPLAQMIFGKEDYTSIANCVMKVE